MFVELDMLVHFMKSTPWVFFVLVGLLCIFLLCWLLYQCDIVLIDLCLCYLMITSLFEFTIYVLQ